MLHDRKGDEELERSIAAIRRQLTSAKARVAERYPNARIHWVLESRQWLVVDIRTRATLEASSNLNDLATGHPNSMLHPGSGTHRRTDTE
jgi:hypothetical protein